MFIKEENLYSNFLCFLFIIVSKLSFLKYFFKYFFLFLEFLNIVYEE